MELPLPANVLVPLGAGALVVLVLLVVGLVVLIRRRRAARRGSTPTMEPIPAQRPTVAHAVAIREADTAPLPVSSADVLARAEAVRSADDEPLTGALPKVADPVPQQREPERASGSDLVEIPNPADPAGSSRPIADAVVQALATRAAREASSRSVPSATPSPATPSTPPAAPSASSTESPSAEDASSGGRPAGAGLTVPPPAPRGDARDRLLAVLLPDPVRTLGAAADLEATTAQLNRLSAAVTHEQSVLGDLLGRLSAGGLAPEQIASLAGLPAAEVRKRLADEERPAQATKSEDPARITKT